MTQLIISGLAMPETSHDKYKYSTDEKATSLRMASGRLVTEVSYTIAVIEYEYDYFSAAFMRQFLDILRPGGDLDVEYLVPDSDAMQRGLFRCVKRPTPQFAFSDRSVPYWHSISFRLEGVDGVD